MIRARIGRPALVWAISVVLGLAAVSTSVVVSWILLSDPAELGWQGRRARESLSAFDWGSVYVGCAMLLASMILLFRLRKSSVRLFVAYVALGALLSVVYAITPEREPQFNPLVTLAVGMPSAFAVLLYMLRLKKHATLV